jgi:hypothetical protein
MKRATLILAALALLFGGRRAEASFITYSWNDDFTNSGFGGNFTVDTSLLGNGPGGTKSLTFASIVSSSFFENRFDFIPSGFSFQVSGVSPAAGIDVNPNTGAVLSSGLILFGASNVLNVGGQDIQILSSQADFNTSYAVSQAETWSYTYTVVGSGQQFPGLTPSFGHWDVNVAANPVPEPSTFTLCGIGAVCLVGYSWRRRKLAA